MPCSLEQWIVGLSLGSSYLPDHSPRIMGTPDPLDAMKRGSPGKDGKVGNPCSEHYLSPASLAGFEQMP